MTPPTDLLKHLQVVLTDAQLTIQFIAKTSIKLWLIAPENMQQRVFDTSEITRILQQPPYWCFAWSSGVAMCQWLLENPQRVMAKNILDFGAGSGCVAIAAKKAGASKVTVCDLDALSLTACRANAALNGVELHYLANLDEAKELYDLIVTADILYDKENTGWLDIFPSYASAMLLADSRIKDFQHPHYQLLTTLEANTLPDLAEPLAFRQVKLYQSV